MSVGNLNAFHQSQMEVSYKGDSPNSIAGWFLVKNSIKFLPTWMIWGHPRFGDGSKPITVSKYLGEYSQPLGYLGYQGNKHPGFGVPPPIFLRKPPIVFKAKLLCAASEE